MKFLFEYTLFRCLFACVIIFALTAGSSRAEDKTPEYTMK